MTTAQIAKAADLETRRVTLRFTTAQRIRTLLDDARRDYGADAWDDDDQESKIIEIVTESP